MNAVSRKIKIRIMIFMGLFCFIMVALIGRTGWIQIVDGAQLKKEAVRQQTRDKYINSKRGTIYDRNNKELAVSASVEMVTASPSEIAAAGSAEVVARELSEILDMDYEGIYNKLTKKSAYEIIKRKVEKEQTDKIRQLKANKETKKLFSGISLEEDTKRYYPFGNFAAHLLGFTGTDNQGLAGIEAAFDKDLRGTPGRIITAKNNAGVDMHYKYEQKFDSKDGLSLVLTIDETIQHFTEKHLEQAVAENNLNKGAAAIVINPKTAEILAMATKPDFDLNNPFLITNEEMLNKIESALPDKRSKAREEQLFEMWHNKALTYTYEPGSIFKIITAASALEEGVVDLDDKFVCNGHVRVGKWNISCWKTAGHGSETFLQGFMNSCNPVFMETGARLGPENFIKYYKAFGFDTKTGFDMAGEGVSIFHEPERFNQVELATSSFGQSFQVTPLQIVTAASAVVNGGYLMKPRIVKELRDSDGNLVESYEPEVVRQVISAETSATMRMMLESVVSAGTGKNAYVKGFRIGGKTGTSEKTPRGTNLFVASFLGIAPANDPQLLCLVLLDEPTGYLRQGGQIAAPVVAKILEDSLRYMGVEEQFTAEELAEMQGSVPNVKEKPLTDAKKDLKTAGYNVKVSGDGDTVIDQLPKGGASLSKNSTVILYTQKGSTGETVTVPDLTGKTPDQAKAELSAVGLNLDIIGTPQSSGSEAVAAKQQPPAGSEAIPASTVKVEFRYLDVE